MPKKSTDRLLMLSLIIFMISLIIIGSKIIWPTWTQPSTADTAAEARQTLRDCTRQADHTATVKTIWAGTPPVPVRYEITCNKLGGK
jgi:hypothetical protein